jgi:hypothetical protein
MSIDRDDHDNVVRGARAYRYYYQAGSLDNPYLGEARGFEEEWQALQYLDENREHAQSWANEAGETILLQVLDMEGFAKDRVVAMEHIRPTHEATRETFARTDRPALAGDKARRKVQ